MNKIVIHSSSDKWENPNSEFVDTIYYHQDGRLLLHKEMHYVVELTDEYLSNQLRPRREQLQLAIKLLDSLKPYPKL